MQQSAYTSTPFSNMKKCYQQKSVRRINILNSTRLASAFSAVGISNEGRQIKLYSVYYIHTESMFILLCAFARMVAGIGCVCVCIESDDLVCSSSLHHGKSRVESAAQAPVV
jgi:hypothetical protein